MKKNGFWQVVSVVISCQVGIGILFLPSQLAVFGGVANIAWMVSGAGAIMLALVFAALCKGSSANYQGPHVYIKDHFGEFAGFLSAWSYWLVSWVSSIAILLFLSGTVAGLFPAIPLSVTQISLLLLAMIFLINVFGAVAATYWETCVTTIKMLVFFGIPCIGIWGINPQNLVVSTSGTLEFFTYLQRAVFITIFAFMGLESMTSSSMNTKDPQRTIPRAIVFGTSIVAVFYLFTNVFIMGIIPSDILQHSLSPYADVVRSIYGEKWNWVVSFLIVLVCMGGLNSWMIVSTQTAFSAAKQCMMPRIFANGTRYNKSFAALVITVLSMYALLFSISFIDGLLSRIERVVSWSVLVILLIYLAASVAHFRTARSLRWASGISIAFCSWLIACQDLQTLMFGLAFPVSAIPVWYYVSKRQ